MKKLVSGMLALMLGAATVCAVTACNDSYETYTVYAPDGAPALALANAVQEEGEGENFDFRIVDSSTIAAQVQGETPNADFCILPVNAAAKFLGTGETYQMLGTVTNGNMYLLTTGENPVITSENERSIGFHRKLGFETFAVFEQVGYKQGRWLDVTWMQKFLGEHRKDPLQVDFAGKGRA